MRLAGRRTLSSATSAENQHAARATAVMPSAAAGAVLPRQIRHAESVFGGQLPAHHNTDGTFKNPWRSYRDLGPIDFFTKALPEYNFSTELYSLPVVAPPWQALARPKQPLQALWVGHVTFLVQCGGWNILTDPQFSKRASFVSWAGPARYTPTACTVAELPPIHAVCISHNHYDHLDYDSVRQLLDKEALCLADEEIRNGSGAGQRQPFTGTRWFVPLRVGTLLQQMGVRPDCIVELDWWQSASVSADSTTGEGAGVGPLVTAVPAQHQSARTAWDRNSSLWCGFVVETPGSTGSATLRWFFSGDTGYRSVPHGAKPGSDEEASSLACPVFKEIGLKYGHIDLAFLPIGAYSPRFFMSSFHSSPEDAVEMHLDVNARRSVGMHWGTFPLTDEPIEEPPVRLSSALARRGLQATDFLALKHGQVYSPTLNGIGGIVTDNTTGTLQ